MSGPIPSDPSFDDFFTTQQTQRRQSSSSSFDQSNPYTHPGRDVGPSRAPTNIMLPQHSPQRPAMMMEEPQTLSRQGSNASVASYHHRQGSSSSHNGYMRGLSVGSQSNGILRTDSLPFDPENSSTLIATAPRPNRFSPQMNGEGNRSGAGEASGGAMLGSSPQLQHPSSPHPPYPYTPPTGQDGFGNQGWNMSESAGQVGHSGGLDQVDYGHQYSRFHVSNGIASTGQDPYAYDQASPFPSSTSFATSSPSYLPNPQTGSWGYDFLGQEVGQGVIWTDPGVGNDSSRLEGILNTDEQQGLAELERIISHSRPGSVDPSRSNSPYPPNDPTGDPFQDFTLDQQPSFSDLSVDDDIMQQLESAISSRSGSPFPAQSTQAQAMSAPATGTLERPGSTPHSPAMFLNKPQSPPALIIPNQNSPAPSLQPIITSQATDSGHRGAQQKASSIHTSMGHVSGGLLPPVNPALEHLTGMAGISPIAPGADGPMIYIQPSTPISGLKEGRGLFDAAIRRAGTAAGSQGQRPQDQQQQQQNEVPPPASHAIDSNQYSPGTKHQSPHLSYQAVDHDTHSHDHWLNESQRFNPVNLRPGGIGLMRPRAKSDSQMPANDNQTFDRQSFLNAMGLSHAQGADEEHFRNAIGQWRVAAMVGSNDPGPQSTLDPRQLPGQDSNSVSNVGDNLLRRLHLSQQYSLLQNQRDRLPALNPNLLTNQTPETKQESGEISPTSLAFYRQLGFSPNDSSQVSGTSSAPFYQSSFQNIPQPNPPASAGPHQSFLTPASGGIGPRRRSFAEGSSHHAVGAGTPGYGVQLAGGLGQLQQEDSPFGTLSPGRFRAVSPGHRRAAKSEDLGRGGGWGFGAGGSTTNFLNSITANDGSLLPPARGRSNSHSRHSSASSIRSVSPALSISSQGSSMSHHSPRMDMPDDVEIPQMYAPEAGKKGRKRVQKMKVTSVATEVASNSRRTNDGVFQCPVPGCGSTFTRHFNLKGHLRSHNDERPYKCLYDGCPKSVVGFARQHDCKRHMLLHEGLRPFECEGCGKKFARLDALTRHHKSEQGQECAISYPLPTNPDGTPMSESQYKAYKMAQQTGTADLGGFTGQWGGQGVWAGRGVKRESSFTGYLGGELSGEDDLGTGSGMDDYDRF